MPFDNDADSSEACMPLQEHPLLHAAFIQNARHTNTLMDLFAAFKQTDVWPELQDRIINHANNHLDDILCTLAAFQFKTPGDLDIIKSALIADNFDILQWLKINRFEKTPHRFIIDLLFTGQPPLAQSASAMSRLKSRINRLPYIESDSYMAQCDAIKQVIDELWAESAGVTEPSEPHAPDAAETLLIAAGMTEEKRKTLRWLIKTKPDSALEIATAFATIAEAGITVEEHYSIYLACSRHPQKIPCLFAALKEAGLTFSDHQLFYQLTIQRAKHVKDADNLLLMFAMMKETGVTFEKHRTLFQMLVTNAHYTNNLSKAFSSIKAAGATLDDNCLLYEKIVGQSDLANDLATAFITMEKAGARIPECIQLYESLIDNAPYLDHLSSLIEKLNQVGMTLPEHLQLYIQVFKQLFGYTQITEQRYFIDKLLAVLSILKKADLSFQRRYQPLWIAAINNTNSVAQMPILLASLKAAGLTLQKEQLPLYELAFQHASHADRLSMLVDALKIEGAMLHAEHLPLLKLVIQHIATADNLLLAFTKLKETGATLREHQWFYEITIQNSTSASLLTRVMHRLQSVDVTIQKHRLIYETLFQNSHNENILTSIYRALGNLSPAQKSQEIRPFADNLLTIFIALQSAGATLQGNLSLYQCAIIYSPYADKLSLAFNALAEAGITLEAEPSLYEYMIEKIIYAETFSIAFTAFRNAGITFQTNRAFYEAIIQNIRFNSHYLTIFVALTENGFWPELESLIINQNRNHFIKILDTLELLDFKAPDDIDIMKSILISNNPESLIWMRMHGFTKQKHHFIFELFFTGSNPLVQSPYTMSKVKNECQLYLQEHPLLAPEDEAYPAQCKALNDIIKKIQKEDNLITKGPLNKSDATKTTEAILKRIAIEDISNIQMRFDDSMGYILQLRDEPEIYLSELLKLTNFNHIELSPDEVNLLGNKIQDLADDFNKIGISSTNCIRTKLPDAAQYALACYLSNMRYKNINRVLRGVPQTIDGNHTWIKPVNGRDNLLASFLTGCLVNWAATMLPHLLRDSQQRQLLQKLSLDNCSSRDEYLTQLRDALASNLITQDEYNLLEPLFSELSILFPNYGLLDRGDDFSFSEQTGELCAIKRFTANKGVFTPAILSLSIFPQGVKYFHPDGSTTTKVETDNSRPIISLQEGEILIPHGTSFKYSQDPSGHFFAREVNSPGIVPNGGYWSSIALAEAFRNHLSKAYADSFSQVKINNISIHRPNHGLAHCYRKMVYIDIVINYFAHHAADPAFQLFCQTVSPEEREWLRVTAAYSVSGRESELSPLENLDKYNQYKEAGKANMEAFLEKYPPANPDEAMRERMLHGVRWLGNPNYEQGSGEHPTINTHPDLAEREHRNFIQRILCVAHNIDLPRCRNSEQFEEDMAICRRLSIESPEQKDDYTHMVDYAAQLIRAHGDSVGGYQSPFEKVSTNLRQLREVTESVTRPKITEPYQFTTPHPQPFSP